MADGEDRRFGELPHAPDRRRGCGYPQTHRHAALTRQPHPVVEDAQPVRAVGDELAPRCRRTRGRGWSTHTGDRRVYLQHAFDLGAYNPCFPDITSTRSAPEAASGTAAFLLVFEGPPGLVRRLPRVFFDCVISTRAVRSAPRARDTLTVTIADRHRWTPELHFDIQRVPTHAVSPPRPGSPSTARCYAPGPPTPPPCPRNGCPPADSADGARPDRWPHPHPSAQVADIVAARLRDDILSAGSGWRHPALAGEPVHRVRREPARVARGDPHPGGRRPGLGAPRQRGGAVVRTCRRPNAPRT